MHEYGNIEREIEVDASPEVVFEMISRPEHIREWWPDDARYEPVPGATGELVWRDTETREAMVLALTVVEVDPPRRFAFRWCYADEDRSAPSLLVTFDLTPTDAGTTRVRMVETGFREMGWEVAVLEEQYRDHATSWDFYLPRLVAHATRVGSRT